MKEIAELKTLTSQIASLLKEEDDSILQKKLWLMERLVDDLANQLEALETKTQSWFNENDKPWENYLVQNYQMLKEGGADNELIEKLAAYDELETRQLQDLYTNRLGFSEK